MHYDVDVDHAALHRASVDINALVPQMQATLRTLDAEIQSLWTTWQGVAPTRLRPVVETWNANYAKLTGSLDGIGRTLMANHVTFASSDEES